MIDVSCGCGTVIHVDEGMLGRKIVCEDCWCAVLVPDGGPEVVPVRWGGVDLGTVLVAKRNRSGVVEHKGMLRLLREVVLRPLEGMSRLPLHLWSTPINRVLTLAIFAAGSLLAILRAEDVVMRFSGGATFPVHPGLLVWIAIISPPFKATLADAFGRWIAGGQRWAEAFLTFAFLQGVAGLVGSVLLAAGDVPLPVVLLAGLAVDLWVPLLVWMALTDVYGSSGYAALVAGFMMAFELEHVGILAGMLALA